MSLSLLVGMTVCRDLCTQITFVVYFSGIFPSFILTRPKMSTVSWKSRLILKTKKKSKRKKGDNFTSDNANFTSDNAKELKVKRVDKFTCNNDKEYKLKG